jgi:protein involved in polysaccharide export with SLBB domain
VAASGALALGLALAVSGPVLALDPPAKPGPELPAITSPDYVIGVGDIIAVQAVGNEEVNEAYPVLSDGTIVVKGIPGSIHAEGMKVKQLTDIVYTGLNKLYNNLNLSVSVRESHSRFVSIVGSRSPGQFELVKNMRVSELIAKSGGLPIVKTKYADGILIRNFKPTKLDLIHILGGNKDGLHYDASADPLLENHDEIIIQVRDESPPPSFEVIGAVTKPGEYQLPLDGSPYTLAQAVASAAGQLQEADLGKVVLIRDQQHTNIDLRPFLRDGKGDAPEARMEIKNGDVLLFPQALAKYMVLGQVNKPAAFPLPENEKISVMRALADAGGPAQNAELHKAGLMRVTNGKPTYIPIDMDKMRRPNKYPKVVEQMNTLMMQDGDVLYIPEKGRPFTISDFISPFYLLSAFGLHPF